MAPGSLGAQLTNQIFSSVAQYIQLIGGVFVILLVFQNQDGIAKESINQIAGSAARSQATFPKLPENQARSVFELPPAEKRDTVTPRTLEVRDLRVRYGGVVAVDERLAHGHARAHRRPDRAERRRQDIADRRRHRLHRRRVAVRSRSTARTSAAGPRPGARGPACSRSFQSLELFEDATVLDNLRAASDPRDRLSYVRDLVYPTTPPLPAARWSRRSASSNSRTTSTATVQDLPYGQRRLLAIARAVATQPSVLLLDEPAAGLGDAETAELAHLVRRLRRRLGDGRAPRSSTT